MRDGYLVVRACLPDGSKNSQHVCGGCRNAFFLPCRVKTLPALTCFSSSETVHAMVGVKQRGTAMGWRRFSAVASAGMSFGFIACTVPAASALEPQMDNSALSQISQLDATDNANASNFADLDLSKVRYEDVRLSWDITRDRYSGRHGSRYSRSCAEPVAKRARPVPAAARRGVGEEHSAARIALVLGVGF
jgi:hypothetical protein